MVKLKKSLGKVKCKVNAECFISKYEISVLRSQPINGLLSIRKEKNLEITYVCDAKRTLAKEMKQGLQKDSFMRVVQQVTDIVINIKRIGLEPEKLVLNPEWIYCGNPSKEIQLIYCPMNGCNLNYDFVLFLRELMSLAKLDIDTRERMNKWLQEIRINGLCAQSMDALQLISSKNKVASVATIVDDEPPTGMDEDDICFERISTAGIDMEESIEASNDGDEPPTDMDENEEGLTTSEDDNVYTSLGKSDGTFLETTSESGYYSERPSLRRISTGEKVVINKDEFKIGRSAQRADYCITNNNSVSNIHATIFTNNGCDYYLKDNRSTNGTMVDGKKVDANGMAVKLRDGARICLFNEELEFCF